MMKKIYTLLLAILCASIAQAQRSVNLELLPTRVGKSFQNMNPIAPYDTILHDSTLFYIKWTVVNHGPDSFDYGDTMHIRSVHNIDFKGYNINIPPGDTIALVPMTGSVRFTPPATATLPYIDTLVWCDTMWAVSTPANMAIIDPPTDNHNCIPVIASAMKTSGINELADGKGIMHLYPNPASDKLRISLEFTGHTNTALLLLRNTIGQVVYSYGGGNLSGSQTYDIDVSNLPRGLYMAELRYDDQMVVSKLMIQ